MVSLMASSMRTRYKGVWFFANKFSIFPHLHGTSFGVDCGSVGDKFVTYLSGIQLTPGVYCHTGATA